MAEFLYPFTAISFESVQSFIEGGDEPVPKLPDNLIGIKRYILFFIYIKEYNR